MCYNLSSRWPQVTCHRTTVFAVVTFGQAQQQLQVHYIAHGRIVIEKQLKPIDNYPLKISIPFALPFIAVATLLQPQFSEKC
jgi:hypothetical protein